VNYSIVNKQGRFLATSYNSFGGRITDLCNGVWSKQPKRWQTHAGAQAYKDGREWLKDFAAVPTPLTRQERRDLLEAHGTELLLTFSEAAEHLVVWSHHLPDGPRQKADEFVSKMNNLILRATGGAR